MRYRSLLIGEFPFSIYTLMATALLLAIFSLGFSAGVELASGTLLTLCMSTIALYAGVKCGGLLIAQVSVFSAIFWRAVFPPLIGYLRWDDSSQYRTIRSADIYLGPEGELMWGIEAGIQYGVLAGVFLGSAAYGIGALYRQLRRDDPSTYPGII